MNDEHSNYDARPLVSVIIPVYNRSGLLTQTLVSLYAMEYRPIEVVIVDDGSSEDIGRIVDGLSAPEGVTVKFIRQRNGGPAKARNRGVRESSGTWLQFLDSDDLLHRDKFSRQLAAAAREREADVIYGDWQQGTTPDTARRFRAKPQRDMVEALLSGVWHPQFSYLYRRECVELAAGWNDEIRLNDDFDFVLRVAIGGSRFEYAHGITGFYRWHPGERISRASGARTAKATFPILESAEAQLREQDGGLADIYAHALAGYYWRLAVNALAEDRQAFEHGLHRSLELQPDFRPRGACAGLAFALAGHSGAAWTQWAQRLPRRYMREALRHALGVERIERWRSALRLPRAHRVQNTKPAAR